MGEGWLQFCCCSYRGTIAPDMIADPVLLSDKPGLEVIKPEYSLELKIKRNDWLLADTCPQAANHCALF